ncbi:hypothetical protein F0U62_41900 [Cystobacter fuscus]|uniref:hypothetical protein n=1 Tax=Cystobacter fuscus TaxID=43 RepID=UPI002B2A7B5D|nr:hypothetical protein F0U62_41900 [Cystobacter fuscus]
MSMGDPNPLRDQLIGAIRADLGDLSSLKSFYWGSLKRADAGADVSLRLAAEAASSALWDAGKGVPRPGGKDVNETVQELLTTADAFREVKSTFHRVGLSMEVSHVEMVRVQPLQGDSLGGGLKSGTLLVPVDGLVELSLHSEAPGNSPSSTP